MRRALFIPIVATFAFAVSACELYLGGHITSQQDLVVPDAGTGPCLNNDGGYCYTEDAGHWDWDGGSPWYPDADLEPDGGCNTVHDGGSYVPDAAVYPDAGCPHPDTPCIQ